MICGLVFIGSFTIYAPQAILPDEHEWGNCGVIDHFLKKFLALCMKNFWLDPAKGLACKRDKLAEADMELHIATNDAVTDGNRGFENFKFPNNFILFAGYHQSHRFPWLSSFAGISR